MDLSKRKAMGDPAGAQGSRILDAYTGNRKPNLRIRSLHVIKCLASAAERMVLSSLQAAQVAEAGLRLHGQPPSCAAWTPWGGRTKKAAPSFPNDF